jgi:type VI secretion system protein ImpC
MAAHERTNERLGVAMRSLLREPAFRAAEALWRSVFFLVRRLETSAKLRIYTVDAEPDDAAAVEALIGETPPGTDAGTRWAAVVLDWMVGPREDDIATLTRIARAASPAGAAVLAGADAGLIGLGGTPAGEMWAALRRSPAARSVGLVLPRMLLREPYGRATDPIDSFPFEELESDPPPHDAFVWGNGAFAAAYVIARGFQEAGWRLRDALRGRIDGLPLVAIEDGTDTKPCAEVWMDDGTAAALLEAGIMPLASVKHAGEVHLVRVQSIAEGGQGLPPFG